MHKVFSDGAEHRLHQIFEVSLLAKALFATSELLLGIALYTIRADWVIASANWLAGAEIIEDPGDRIAGSLLSVAQHYSVSTQHFWAFYLVSHALVKLVVVLALRLRLLWAYPVSIVVLVGFIAYQLVRFASTHSPFLIALTLFDLVVIWLVWHEYQRLKAQTLPA